MKEKMTERPKEAKDFLPLSGVSLSVLLEAANGPKRRVSIVENVASEYFKDKTITVGTIYLVISSQQQSGLLEAVSSNDPFSLKITGFGKSVLAAERERIDKLSSRIDGVISQE